MSTSKTPTEPMVKPKRSNYFFPEGLKNGLSQLAERQGVSEAALVRKAVESLLKRNKVEF